VKRLKITKMKTLMIYLTGCFLLLTGTSTLAAKVAPSLPLTIQEEKWRPLYDHVDSSLQTDLEVALQKNKFWRDLIGKKKMAVGVVDLSNPDAPRFARVNGRTMMYAASLPKIAILLAAYVSFDDGSLKETPEIRKDLVEMIRTSNNPAASRMIDRIGFKKIQAVLMDPRFQLYDQDRGGGLWVGKRYAQSGRRSPDPMKGLCHAATVTQVCRFYYLLANGKIINPERSHQILDILSEPHLNHKFVNQLDKLVPITRIFRKSGTWKTYHSDSVLVWGEVWRRYILVALVESEKGEQIMRDLVPVVERILRPGRVS